MKWGVWVPPWIPVRSNICARFDCNLVRELGRRYCGTHAKEYDEECATRSQREAAEQPLSQMPSNVLAFTEPKKR